MAEKAEKVSFKDRAKQFWFAFTFTRKHDKLIIPLLLGAFLLPVAIGVAVSAITGMWLYIMPASVLLGVLAALIIFGRRVAKATYAEVEGKPGAAAAILQNMRGNWRMTPAVAVTPQQDVIHRLIGRPGVILIVEGAPSRLKNLHAQEKKRIARVAPDMTIYDVFVGDGENQVPLRKLQTHLVKLPRNITPKQINALEGRLQALGNRPPIPQGPMPKNARMPKMRMQRR